MTSPNVGKITLQAAIESGDLRSQLTKAIQDEVMPQLRGLQDEIRASNDEINKLNSKPVHELAAAYGLVSDELEKVEDAERAAEKARIRRNNAELQYDRTIRRRGELYSKLSEEVKKYGQATEHTKLLYEEAVKAEANALDTVLSREEELENYRDKIGKARLAAQKRHHSEVMKMRDAEMSSLRDLINNSDKAANAIIADAIKRSNAEIAAAERASAARERLRAQEERARDRASAKAERDADRAARRQERQERLDRARARRGLTGPASVVGEIGRALSGFAPRLSTGAFATIASAALVLAGAAASASQSLWLLPAAAGAAGAALGTLTLATAGFGDTISALLSGDLDKFDEAIQKLSPSAQQTALEFQAWLPILKDVQQRIQETFFSGAPQMFANLATQYVPIFDKMGTNIAAAFNRAMRGTTDLLLQPDTITQIDKITNDIIAFFNRLSPAVVPLTEALLDIMEVGAEFLPGLADGAGNLAERFRDFIREAKESGKLHEWLERGLQSVGEIAKIVWDMGRAFMSLAPVAEKILPGIVAFFDGFADLLTNFPALIYAIPIALMTWAGAKGLMAFMQSLHLVSLMLGVTVPQMAGKAKGAITGLFTSTALTSNTGLIGGLSAAENGLDRTATKASRLGTVLSGLGRIAGPTALLAGGTLLAEDIISKNIQSTTAVSNYREVTEAAKDAQLDLNAALLASGGAWDMASKSAGDASIRSSLEKAFTPTNGPSWLDQFRDDKGSLWGGFLDQITDFSGDQDSKANRMNQRRDEMQQALGLITEKFGTDMKGLREVITGSQGGFDALIKNFRDMGPRGDDAADALLKVREEIVGVQSAAAEAGPVLQRLGPDVEKSATEIKNAFDALPENVPINIHDTGGEEAVRLLEGLGQQITTLPDGTIKLDDHLLPEVKQALHNLGVDITELPDKQIAITIDQDTLRGTKAQIADLKGDLASLVVPPITGVPAPGTAPQAGPPRPGGSPLEDLLRGNLPKPVPGVPPPVAPPPGVPGQRPVPPSPVDERGDKITDADRKKAIEESINPKDFMVDPWAGVNAPQVGGNGGLNVNIVGGLPGMPGGLNLFGGGSGGALPSSLTSTDPGSIAQYIAQYAMAQGYTADEARAFVAQAVGESGLVPSAFGKNTGDASGGASGIFQFTPGTWQEFGQGGDPLDAMANIAAYFRLAQARDPRSGDIKSRLAAISGGGPAHPSNPGWAEAVARANNLLGSWAPAAGGMPVAGGAPGARNVTGLFGGQTTAGIDQLAQLVAQYFPGVNLGGWRPSDGPNTPTGHQRGVALDIGIQDQAMGDKINAFLRANASVLGINSTIWRDQWKDFKGNQSTVTGHQDHVHVEVDGKDIAQGIGTSLKDNLFATNGPGIMDPLSGESGYFQVDQQAVLRAQQAVEAAGRDVSRAAYELAVATEQHRQNLISDQDLIDKQWALQEANEKLQNEQADFAEAQRGKFKEDEKMDFSKLPFGDPRKILAGAITGAGGSPEDVAALVSPLLGSVAQPIGQAAGDATRNALSAFNLPTREGPASDVDTLVRQRNPLALAGMAGYNVPDYSVAGGGPGAQNLLTNQGPPGDASGRMFSDTGALLDRSFTNLQAALEAKIDQLTNVVNQVKDQLTEQVLGPTVEKAVAGALDGAATELGKTIGETAGPIIANAVAQAIPKGNSGSGGSLVQTGVGAIDAGGGAIIGGGGQPGGFFDLSDSPGFGPLFGAKQIPGFAIGGPVRGPGTETSDSILARLSAGEWVVNARDVRRAGGFRGMREWTKSLPGFATGGGVIGDENVGADFFGVSQVPILGAIVNLLVRVLLKVIGVTIEVRDTLDEMSSDFRQFRGDSFRAFEASGRLMNDTSALLDRTNTSEQAAADERIRILKLVIEGIIKFIIEKLVVPIGKAIANSLINAGAGAAGGAIGASFPGGSIVGGMVSSVISSAGSAGVDIAAEIFTEFSLALTSVLVDMIAEGLQGLFPDLIAMIFGGGLLAGGFDPITALFTATLGPLLGLLGGLGDMISLPSFDEGGVAPGVGFMPKATIRPERVLSPQQTASFDRLVDAITSGKASATRSTVVHAPITVLGDRRTGENVQNRLLALMD